ncbi:tRNA dihydrouridine synthase DusB [soil metagenome]
MIKILQALPMKTFWDREPLIGLAPMDGVTDAAFRYIVDMNGKSDLLLTEFVAVEGITAGAIKLLEGFVYHPTETPTIAQIYGTEPDAFYKAAIIVAELGFDGIDINMGCPDKSVSGRGAGAGLIRTPDVAKKIVRSVKQAIQDWSEGQSLENAGLRPKVVDAVRAMIKQYGYTAQPRILPVSVKTRTGFETPTTKEWINHLLETEPINITLHGRTLKQMYTGLADWEQIGIAAETAKNTKTYVMGNGDIKSLTEAKERIKTYGLHGVLIGRATFGNPWLFKDIEVDHITRLKVGLEHCRAFERLLPEGNFLSLRKHMAWYCKGFEHSAEMRVRLMTVKSAKEVEEIVAPIISAR